ERYVALGRDEVGEPVVGGARPEGLAEGLDPAAFYTPTIFSGVDNKAKIAQEEIFGPVLSCIRFRDEHHALEIANGTPYGLAASLWTRDVAKAHAMARKVKSGVVWINCFNEFDDAAPFGGYKESGWGRDLSHHALEGYLQYKAVWTKLPAGL
ncbi:MAG TPA: aldehyde dehydrogenase family protein, partial [Myxococcaceae bacterium]|nr:aldehyde dehydrogenase family protein [Myxococcaceae bacterium]